MKIRMLFLSFLVSSLIFTQSLFAQIGDSPKRPKIGLVLSGGGAKGFAHVGVLKMLDSLQIPIDYIAGTSMGSIAGALYAIGYSGIDLEKLAYRSDWQEIFTDKPPRPDLPYFQKEQTGKYQLEFGVQGVKPMPPSGLIFGQKVSLLFSSLTFPYERITDFDQLPIPFRCVAVDLVTGNQVVIKNGSLAKAMRASMAIPTVFSPVEWGDSLLVDGGLLNNLPVDVVKQMGADIVIAVDVQSPLLARKQLTSALSVLEQTVSPVGIERVKENLKQVDLLIRPDIEEFTAADFDNMKIREIVRRGD
ncbi:MAG TPA: patatin-like phospholipase family protein, partial [bacterium]